MMLMLTSYWIAAQYFYGIRQGHVFGAFAVNFQDAVAGDDAGLEAGRVFHRRDDSDEIVFHRDDDSEPAEMAFGIALEILVFVGVKKFAVGVQFVNHPLSAP